MAEEQQLTIGELASRTGVATSTLRYWEEVGLLPAPARVGGRRRYPPSVVGLVGAILLLQDVGFTLREIKAFVEPRTRVGDVRRELFQRKIAELDRLIHQAQVARNAIAHGMGCPHEDVFECPTFADLVASRLAGLSLEEAHPDGT